MACSFFSLQTFHFWNLWDCHFLVVVETDGGSESAEWPFSLLRLFGFLVKSGSPYSQEMMPTGWLVSKKSPVSLSFKSLGPVLTNRSAQNNDESVSK